MRRITAFLVAIGLLFGREAFSTTQLVINGNFEAVPPSANWLFSPLSTTSSGVVFNPGDLSMGIASGASTQIIFQTVTIPTNTLFALYSYVWNASSSDPSGDAAFAGLVLNASGTAVLANLNTQLNQNIGATQNTFNLTAFVGQTIGLAFEVQVAAGALNSTFNVTAVSLAQFTAADIPVNDFFTNSTTLTNINVTALGTNVLATKEPGEPPKIAGNAGGHSLWWNWTAPGNGEVTINTSGSSFETLLGVFTGTSVSHLTSVASSDGSPSRLKVTTTAGTTYQIAVDGKNGAIGLIQLNLTFSPDTKNPTVAISSPKTGAKLTNSTVAVTGTASDNLAVAAVQFRLENAAGTNDYQDATGTNKWSATVINLIPGPNTIRVRAFDTSSNESASVAHTVTFAVVSPLTLTTSGTGTISPKLGPLQDVGTSFTITAKPGTGQVFSNWSGDVSATTATLTFTMQSNMMVQANFVPNPFVPFAGVYQGLFFDTNAPEHQSSGFFSATLASAGSFSAKITLAGKSYSLSGQFSAGGFASNNIVRKGLTTVAVQLNLDLNAGVITGQFSDGVWTAELNAARPAGSPVAQAGHYTLLVPGAADGVGHPGGDSYGTVTVSSTAGITFAGVLADGTKVTQKADLLPEGQWPFYIPLYSGNGSIFGWLTFNNGVISGTVDWFKLAGASGKFYPTGFTNSTEAVGSSYLFTNGIPVLNFSSGQVSFSNGNLVDSFANQITLGATSKITNQSPNALTLTITTSSGLFKGSVVNPAGGKAIPINGVVLQQQNVGGGFFLGTNQTGRVFIGP